MVSVTSEVSANTSFQNAAAKSARPDSEHPPETTASRRWSAANGRQQQRQSHPGQRARPAPLDDTQAASNSRSRDNAAASDRADNAARNNSNDRNAAAKARSDKARDDGKIDTKADPDTKTDTDTKAATTRRGKSKTDAAKSDGAKSDETTQASSGDASRQPIRPRRRRMKRPW